MKRSLSLILTMILVFSALTGYEKNNGKKERKDTTIAPVSDSVTEATARSGNDPLDIPATGNWIFSIAVPGMLPQGVAEACEQKVKAPNLQIPLNLVLTAA